MSDFTSELCSKFKLSNREREIIDEVLTGARSKEIGKKLFIEEKTVKFHLTNIYRKIGIESRGLLFRAAADFTQNKLEEHLRNLPKGQYSVIASV